MPYSASDISALPANVQSLPAGQRRQWVTVWNAAFSNCRSSSKGGGAGSIKDCEGVAFRMANGVIAKASKEGRVLSAANMRSMVEAMQAMLAVMRKAGFEMEHMGEKDGHRRLGASAATLRARGHLGLAARVDTVAPKLRVAA